MTADPAAEISPSKRPILLVEDDSLLRDVLREHLHNLGFEAMEASNGREALALIAGSCAASAGPALIITDIEMPEMNGLETVKAMRGSGATLPIIMCSSLTATGASTTLDALALPWGIVTNKAERFALPLMRLLGYGRRAACIIGGDTTGKLKPHPEPLYAAARAIGAPPQHCLYIGDDERDIQAGQAAGMKTLAVRYGYLNGSDPLTWGAHAVISAPMETLSHL